jgi:signal recognition particle GTPase
MTKAERDNPDMLNSSRKKRIAAGCGLQVVDVNRLLKQFGAFLFYMLFLCINQPNQNVTHHHGATRVKGTPMRMNWLLETL